MLDEPQREKQEHCEQPLDGPLYVNTTRPPSRLRNPLHVQGAPTMRVLLGRSRARDGDVGVLAAAPGLRRLDLPGRRAQPRVCGP